MGRVLVTGSAGHLGEGLARALRGRGVDTVSVDVLESGSTLVVGSITDRELVRRCMRGVDVVIHTGVLQVLAEPRGPTRASESARDFCHGLLGGALGLL